MSGGRSAGLAKWRLRDRATGRRHQREERGSALVEVVWLMLLLMIPMVYLLISLVTVQRAAFGVTAAARAAGRAYVLAPTPAVGRQRAYQAARVAMGDQGLGLPFDDLVIVCHPTPQSCLRPGSSVRVSIRYQSALPLAPTFLGHQPATIAVSAVHVEPFGRFREASR